MNILVYWILYAPGSSGAWGSMHKNHRRINRYRRGHHTHGYFLGLRKDMRKELERFYRAAVKEVMVHEEWDAIPNRKEVKSDWYYS